MNTITGKAITDDHWMVTCPRCGRVIEYVGFFDSTDIEKCDCGEEFKVERIMFEDGTVIK